MMNHVSANLVVNICRDLEVVADRSRITAIGFDREAVSWTPRWRGPFLVPAHPALQQDRGDGVHRAVHAAANT